MFTNLYQKWQYRDTAPTNTPTGIKKQSRTPNEPKMHDNDKTCFVFRTACLCPNSCATTDDRQMRMTDKDTPQQRCARSKAWNLVKNIFKLKEKDKVAFYFPVEEWVLPAASTKESEERGFVVDSAASMHMVSKKDLNSAELETIKTSRSPTSVMTANGEVQTREKLTQFFPWGNSVRIMGLHTTGPAVKNHTSSEMAREFIAINPTMYHLWFLVYQRVLPQLHLHLTSPTSSSQDSVFDVNRYTQNPVPERSGSTSEELRGDLLHESTETENKKW